jgi:NUMOD4 motif
MAEKWRDIAGYDGVYQVSDLGQVRNTQTSKVLHPTKLKNGRIYVALSSDGFQKKCTIYSLVADAFLGECPAGHEIRQGLALASSSLLITAQTKVYRFSEGFIAAHYVEGNHWHAGGQRVFTRDKHARY